MKSRTFNWVERAFLFCFWGSRRAWSSVVHLKNRTIRRLYAVPTLKQFVAQAASMF